MTAAAADPATARVRQLVTDVGYQPTYRHSRLPGQPAVAVALRRKLIFMLSCGGHGHIHPGCTLSVAPRIGADVWMLRRARTRERDRRLFAGLRARRWDVLVVWECQLGRAATLRRRIRAFLERRWSPAPAGRRA